MQPQATIIVPIRNESEYIDQCLSSLAHQTVSSDRYEVIVVDGCSTDGTQEIVKRYCQDHSNFKLVENPQLIVPYALNAGISLAQGEIIIRVDGHCYVEKEFIELCIAYSQSKNVACVGGIIQSINKTFTGKVIALGMSSKFGVGNVSFRTGAAEGYVDTLAFGAYKKDIFKNIGHFDPELVRCQDDEFNYRLRKSGEKIFLTPLIKVYYFPRANLLKLLKQYFQYGFWKVRVLQKHPNMMQPRQFVPAIFVSTLLISGIGQFFYPPLGLLFSVAGLSYLAANILSSVYIALKNNISSIILLPLVYLILHFSYGTGFLLGMVYFINRWKK